MESPFTREQIVTFHLGSQTLRWCQVLTIKHTENNEWKYDLIVEGIRLYDVDSSHLEDIGVEATKGTKQQVF